MVPIKGPRQWCHAKWQGHISGQGVYEENVFQMLALGGGSVDTVEKEEADISEEGETEDPDGSETEHSVEADESENQEAKADTHVLKMLYKGNMEEISRQEQQSKKAKVYNRKHNCYCHT